MFFCSLTTLDANNKIIGTQYAPIELFNAGNPPTTLADALTICKASNSAFDVVNGVFSYSADVNSIETLLDTYFAFDASIFEQILGGTIVAFAIGLGAGSVVKMMMRT